MITNYIRNLIENFNEKDLINFFRVKSKNFKVLQEPLNDFNLNDFTNTILLGEIKLNDFEEIVVITSKVLKQLSDRSGKKAQYELGKKFLKSNPQYAGGFFVFYDDNHNFRFSFIHSIYKSDKRYFNSYKRYTYFVEKNQPYHTFQKALYQLTLDSIENIISVFAVQPLVKQFYSEIQNWYAWALSQEIIFPGGNKEENLIRLITRIIFVWFLKQRNLVPDKIFNEEFLSKIVKDFNKKDYYYNAILQNLFFATLNKPHLERKFADNANFDTNRNQFGVKTLFRYDNFIKISKEEFVNIFKDVPFVNGGLFECLDEDKNYIDGFSRNEKKRAKIPDFLFFSDEKEEDLSSFYGERKKAKVRGLINILKDYNFTVDESSPIDVEVSLDPELLGHIFENLLASYNPETKTTARKATGSYYTPKEIVDYMAEESLVETLHNKTNINRETLKNLFSYSDDKIELSEDEVNNLIKSIDTLKIIDPAVGSGAFPMGIVHKLVHLLNKIDPDNKKWQELQYNKALDEVKNVLKINDKVEREMRLREINDVFDEALTYPDYSRKLYLIQNSIYGVDIQNIAIQICKLRFFLSLLIDQKIDRERENFGIKPLPHLETNFVTANTLIGLERTNIKSETIRITEIINELKNILDNEKPDIVSLNIDFAIINELKKYIQEVRINTKNMSFGRKYIEDVINRLEKTKENLNSYNPKVKEEEFNIEKNKLKMLYKKHFSIKTREEKIEIQDEARKIRENIKQKLVEYGFPQNDAQKIADFDIFDQRVSADWFDPEWMFGVDSGFDIVIANPPYIQLQKDGGKLAKLYEGFNFKTFDRMGDIYCLFYEKGIELLKNGGHLCFITSNKWMRAGYGEKLRKFFLDFNPKLLIDLGPGVFESATVDTCIFLIENKKPESDNKLVLGEVNSGNSDGNFNLRAFTLQKEDLLNINSKLKDKSVIIKKLNKDAWFIGSDAEQKLKEKIESIGKPLKEWDVKIYRGILTGLNEAFIITTEKRNEILANCKDRDERKRTEAIIKPILRGRDIKRYYYEWAGLWVIGTFPALKLDIDDYPALKKYFLNNFDLRQLEQSGKKYPELGFNARKKTGNKWFETQDQIAYYSEFEKERVVYGQFQDAAEYCYCEAGIYLSSNEYMIGGNYNRKYFLGILNSKLIEWYLLTITGKLGNDLKIGQKSNFQKIPIPDINSNNKFIVKQIENLVTKIIVVKKSNPKTDTSIWEREIDNLVYSLYELTDEEIRIIEQNK